MSHVAELEHRAQAAAREDANTYIGRCPKCQAVVAAMVINGFSSRPDDARERQRVSSFVSELIRDGLIVERVTSAYVRETLAGHTCALRVRAVQENLL